MRSFPSILEERIEKKRIENLFRSLVPRAGLDFSSNDYLGFSEDPELSRRAVQALQNLPLGSAGSRLLRGNLEIHETAEAVLADFSGGEAALLFPSGYQANLGLISALLGPEDFVFSDQLNHASMIDGVRLSAARKVIFPHGDLAFLRRSMEEARGSNPGLKVILTESLFSMDGDLASLQDLADLAEEFPALLIVDETHATGMWGDFSQNRAGGWVQALGLRDRVFATVHGGGKALGVGGGWICGSTKLKTYLMNHARPWIFSTAPIPALPVFLMAAIEHWKSVGQERVNHTLNLCRHVKSRLRMLEGQNQIVGPILPIVVGDAQKSIELAAFLQESGFDVRAIRPPTVPVGSSRLRLTIHWKNTVEEIEKLAGSINSHLSQNSEGSFR